MRGLRSFLFLLTCAGCIEPYNPVLSPSSLRALVVDGYIDAGGSASVKLSRSIPLNANSNTPAEKSATVTIESSTGETFNLTEGDSALYTASNLAVSINDTYTLHIRTGKGVEYVSDAIEIYPSPVIDSIRWAVSAAGGSIEVFVDAHDENPDATGLYLWDCVETYEYKAPLFVGFKLVNGVIRERFPDELLYTCWRTNIQPSVMFNTRILSENIISGKKVASIPKGSPRISVRYSILVKQRSISDPEYAFRTQLQKSTEQQASLFAAIPGTVVSNVHSLTSPGEYVLGYFRGQEVHERRFFIDFDELPKDFKLPHDKEGCQTEVSCPIVDGVVFNADCINPLTLGNNALIVSANTDGRGVIESYNIATSGCGDCTQRGGTVIKPPFW